VAPIMLRDELVKGSVARSRKIAGGTGLQTMELRVVSPQIRHANSPRVETAIQFDSMGHRRTNVILTLEETGPPGDHGPGHELLNEDNGSSPAVRRLTPDVKPQIDFLKVLMERYWHPKHSGPHEHKSHERDEGLTLPRIQFRAERHERPEQ